MYNLYHVERVYDYTMEHESVIIMIRHCTLNHCHQLHLKCMACESVECIAYLFISLLHMYARLKKRLSALKKLSAQHRFVYT